MKIANLSQIFSTKEQEPAKSTFSGKLWINYTKKVSSLKLTDSKNLNIVIKVAVYVTTIAFVLMANQATLLVDAARYLYKEVYVSYGSKGESASSSKSLINKLFIASIGASSLIASTYAMRSYGFI